MKQGYGRQFLLGFAAGVSLGAVFWYWRKSTTADEGALRLLDELAEARAKAEKARVEAQQLAQRRAPAPSSPAAASDEPDDLTAIRGIGPVYARRLQEGGIKTYATLAAQDPAEVRRVAQLKEWHAADPAEWIAAAQALSEE
jgi:predicted flap endonuclease-1-like 5' DNA nuclease